MMRKTEKKKNPLRRVLERRESAAEKEHVRPAGQADVAIQPQHNEGKLPRELRKRHQ